MKPGRIIILNGTSSAGKSTLARALRTALPEPFCFYASDQLAEAGFRPARTKMHALCDWTERASFFDGFHRSIASFAAAGNDLIVEHIVEEPAWATQLHALLAPFDRFWVGVHAPLDEIERRERERGDRTVGEAREHLKTHAYCRYDIDVDTTRPHEEIVAEIIEAWRGRTAMWGNRAQPS